MECIENCMKTNLKMSKNVLIQTLVLLIISTSCSLPKTTYQYTNKTEIKTHYGPEDFVIDSIPENPRLLIVCDDRRNPEVQGEVWQMDLKTEQSSQMKIRFKEEHHNFKPHGTHQFGSFLYVVNHISKKEEEIIRFTISGDELIENKIYKTGFIGSANDVFVVGEDEFYYTDYQTFGGSLIHYKNGVYTKVSKHYMMPNGLEVVGKDIYLTTTLGGKVYKIDGDTFKKKKVAKIKGGDNFMRVGDVLYITSHQKFGKFKAHYKDAETNAPSVLYAYNMVTKELEVVYSNDGSEINTCSTGIIFNDKIYLGQVFQNYILVKDLKD